MWLNRKEKEKQFFEDEFEDDQIKSRILQERSGSDWDKDFGDDRKK